MIEHRRFMLSPPPLRERMRSFERRISLESTRCQAHMSALSCSRRDRRRSPPRPERERRARGRRRADRHAAAAARRRSRGCARSWPSTSRGPVLGRADALPRRPRGRRRGAGRADRRPRGRGRHAATRVPATRGSGSRSRPTAWRARCATATPSGRWRSSTRRDRRPGTSRTGIAEERVAITGDLLQDGDVAWVPFGGPWADGRARAHGRVAASGSRRWTRCGRSRVTGRRGDRRARGRRRQPRALRALPRGPVAGGLARGAPRDGLAPDDRAALRRFAWPRCRGCRWRRPRSTSRRSSLVARVLDGLSERGVVVRDGDRVRHHRPARRAHRFGTQSARFGVDP